MATSAPSRARSSAISRPIRLAAPVTRARLPASGRAASMAAFFMPVIVNNPCRMAGSLLVDGILLLRALQFYGHGDLRLLDLNVLAVGLKVRRDHLHAHFSVGHSGVAGHALGVGLDLLAA